MTNKRRRKPLTNVKNICVYKSEVHKEIIVLIRLDGLIRGDDEMRHDGRASGWLAGSLAGRVHVYI